METEEKWRKIKLLLNSFLSVWCARPSCCIVYQSVVYQRGKSSLVSPSRSPSLGAALLAVTYNYSADLSPVSVTSTLQRSCRSVEESIVGVPGGFLDNEFASRLESFTNGWLLRGSPWEFNVKQTGPNWQPDKTRYSSFSSSIQEPPLFNVQK